MAKKTIQKDLFGRDSASDDREKLPMEDITKERRIREVIEKLNAATTMEQLRPLADILRHMFRKYKCVDSKSGDVIACMESLYGGLKYKQDYLIVVSNIFGSANNFRLFYKLLDKDTRTLLDYLFLHGFATGDVLNKVTDHKWTTTEKRGWRSYVETILISVPEASLLDSMCFSMYSYGPRTFFLRGFVWDAYAKYIFAERYSEILKAEGLTDLPNDDGYLVTYNNEKQMGNYITVIQQMVRQGAVDFGDKKMTAANAKKIAKKVSFPEFFDKPVLSDQKNIACVLALPMLALYVHGMSENVIEYWSFLKEKFKKNSIGYVLFDILGHLKGLRRDFILGYMKYDRFEQNLRQTLSCLTPQLWYPARDIIIRMYDYYPLDRNIIFPLAPQHIEHYAVSAEDVSTVTAGHSKDYIQEPLYFGILALYAGMGLIEVAYDKEAIFEYGYYDFIQYIRLTPLGAYVLDIYDSYQAEDIHMPSEYFDVDADRLIIRSQLIDGKNPYNGILTDLAERISDTRYRVTPISFLSNCTDLSSILAKINYFKENICAEPSPIWQQFFQQMQRRCHPLKKTTEQYSVRRLDPSDKELMQLFMTDSYLRKHSLRGENYTILIETRFMPKVEEKLRSYGYLM